MKLKSLDQLRLPIGLLAAVVCSNAESTVAQDCVDEASDHRLRIEMVERGYTRWGCDTELAVMCRWDAAPDPNGDDWFELNVWSVGKLRNVNVTYKWVFADSLVTWWPAQTETLWATVRALDPDGASAWADTSIAFIVSP